ncbi:hypothetical protein [Streptomyces sp. T21Q-yed]|uniref:hypothetical protein n=1 Tax=Streptomyces sp. T21Q-yed TaxID=3018441 RepID=UPI0023DE87BD|nr:hypothetical protein [Streptomyces sp. T21Q-yed]MDF3140404.1 hypothetical protein [Streptomyces sp. T21Q-yed]
MQLLGEDGSADLHRARVGPQNDLQFLTGGLDVSDETLADSQRYLSDRPLLLRGELTQGRHRIGLDDLRIEPQLPPTAFVHRRQRIALLPKVFEERSLDRLHVGDKSRLLGRTAGGVLGELS